MRRLRSRIRRRVHLHPEAQSFLAEIPEGRAGVEATIGLMGRIVKDWRRRPEMIALARDIVSQAPPKRYGAEANFLFEFVRDEIRYTRDVADLEVVQTPNNTLAMGHGDCDDLAVLLATLLSAVGHPTRFVAAGFDGGELEHVWVETLIGSRWYAADVTEPNKPFGWRPAGITSQLIWHI